MRGSGLLREERRDGDEGRVGKLLVHGEFTSGSRAVRMPGTAASASISARDFGGVSAP